MVWMALLEKLVLVGGVSRELRAEHLAEPIKEVVGLALLPQHNDISRRWEEDLLAEHVS